MKNTPNNPIKVTVPLVRQSFDYSCGAAALASILYYWGVWDGREPELYRDLGTCNDGTPGYKIMQVAESFGLSVASESNMTINRLRALVDEGCTVILNVQAWGVYDEFTNWEEVWEDGHYVVLVGIEGEDAYLMDPAIAGRYGVINTAELLKRWHDWSDWESSDGEYTKEYHTGIIIKGARPETSKPLVIA